VHAALDLERSAVVHSPERNVERDLTLP
jgi:hypothetical protein